jgi:hypothetical protein
MIPEPACATNVRAWCACRTVDSWIFSKCTGAAAFAGHRARDLLNVHYASGYGTTAALSGFRPWMLSVWGSDVYDFPYESRLKGWWLRRNLRQADLIGSTSEAMAQQVKALVPTGTGSW